MKNNMYEVFLYKLYIPQISAPLLNVKMEASAILEMEKQFVFVKTTPLENTAKRVSKYSIKIISVYILLCRAVR